MPKSYQTTADKSQGDSTRFFRWWQHKHKHQSVKTTENDSDNDYTDVHYIFDPDAPYMNSTNSTFASNHFFKKKLILGDISARRGPVAQPITTVIVIASIFLFITMSITAATVVFCKKKNTVFVLNKSEQEDLGSDYEMDELTNTDMEYGDFGSEMGLNRKKSASTSTCISKLETDLEDTRRPLVANFDDNMDDQRYLVSDMPYRSRTLCENEQKGYRRLTVSAVVEKPGILGGIDSENEESPYRIPSNLSKQKNKGFYRLTMVQSDVDSDCENSPAHKKRVPNKRVTGRKLCKCADSSDINWDNIKILPSQDGEELMLYEAKAECDICDHKGQGQFRGRIQGQGQIRNLGNVDKFENIPLDNYVGDACGKGRYRKVPTLVESPFHTHSKGGAVNGIKARSPEVIVNRNFEDVGLTLPVKSVYDNEANRTSGAHNSNHSNQRGSFRRGHEKSSKESCRVHGVQNDTEDEADDEMPDRRRYVLYELPRHRSQGTNTGVTVSTQTGESNELCEIGSNPNCDANYVTIAPSGGKDINRKQMSSPGDRNANANQNVNKTHTPTGGKTLSEIIIDPNMSSVQGILPNAENSSGLLNEVSPFGGRFDNQRKIFQDVSCHSDICLSLMSPTEVGSLSSRQQQTSEIVSHNATKRSSPPNEANNEKLSKNETVSRARDMYTPRDACSRSDDKSEQSMQDSTLPHKDDTSEISNSVSEQDLAKSPSFPQSVPPVIPPRRFKMQLEDNFARGNQWKTRAEGGTSNTSPIGQVLNHSPSSIVSPNQTLPSFGVAAARGRAVDNLTSRNSEHHPLTGVSHVTSPQ
ncbi:uncharacterized protein LOC135498844 [Lineus longissimus]|uniref:uncharacterized protein LOC135498844 n=1 Tax=Lineus longissimus TaxID=88925 RepID=UPI002B4F7CA7